MPKITYSGLQAAFSFDGIQVGKDQTVEITTADLKKISTGKVFKALLDVGDITVEEDIKTKAPAGGKSKDASKLDNDELTVVQAELTKLGITYTEDETLEQLQAMLTQAKE